MSEYSVLYDAPGPRARRRSLIGGLIASAVILVALGIVVKRLADQGQFDAELYRPLVDPGHEFFRDDWRTIGGGLINTLKAAALAIAFSVVLGTLLGGARMMLGHWGRVPLIGVIELLRGLPVIISIFYASRVLPALGLDLSGMPGGSGLWYLVIGLTAYNMVIIAEILRAGVASLPSGQREAAWAIGLTPGATMRMILLPQAVRTMLPALISQIVVILKDTSLAAVLGLYEELLRRGNLLGQYFDNPLQMLFLVAVIFIVLNYLLSRLARWLEARLSHTHRTATTPEDVGETGAVRGLTNTGV
jgi:glutamate transport system permease protein